MKTADWKANAFNVGNAYMLANCASLAYDEDKDKTKNTLMEKFGMQWVQFFRIEETEAFIMYNDLAFILAFRGTSSPMDALTDIKIKFVEGPNGKGKIHEGFKTGLDKIWNEVWNTMGRKRGKRTLWITGHSLGGALALTAAARLAFEKNKKVDGLYTFGQPRVGDPVFTDACHNKFGNNYFRFVHNNDIVPRIPLRIMGFEHTGIFKYINSVSQLDNSLTWEELTKVQHSGKITDLLKTDIDGVKDHSMINYLNGVS